MSKENRCPNALSKVAEAARIQRSHLSNVLAGRSSLSSDQLFLIGRWLQLPDSAMEYLSLLLERDRCQVAERSKILDVRIKNFQRLYQRSDEQVVGPIWTKEDIGLSQLLLPKFCALIDDIPRPERGTNSSDI